MDSSPVTCSHASVSVNASPHSRPRSTSLRNVSMPSLKTVQRSESSPDQFGACSGKNCSGRTKSGSRFAKVAGSTGSGRCCAIFQSPSGNSSCGVASRDGVSKRPAIKRHIKRMAGFAYISGGYRITPVQKVNLERYSSQHFLLDGQELSVASPVFRTFSVDTEQALQGGNPCKGSSGA